MFIRFQVLLLCFVLFGCFHVGQQTKVRNPSGVWQASENHGDKPGLGIELVEHSGKIDVKFFLLDPNKPRNFTAGRELPTEVLVQSTLELHVAVHVDENRTDQFILNLESALNQERVNAKLRNVEPNTVPVDLMFVRRR